MGPGTSPGQGQGPGSAPGNSGSQSSRDPGKTSAQARATSPVGRSMPAGAQAMAQDRAARQAEMALEDRDIAAAAGAESPR